MEVCTAPSWTWSSWAGWSCLEDTEGLGRLGRRAARAEGRGARGCVMVVLGRRQIRGAVWQMMTFSYLLLVCLSVCLPVLANRTDAVQATEKTMKREGWNAPNAACRVGSVGCSRLRSSLKWRVPAGWVRSS